MQTQTQTKTTLNANLAGLPILKHFDQNEISTKVDNFRKGEKNLFWFFKLAALVGVGYLTWTYVLPPVFVAIGQMLAVAATAVLVVTGIIMAPVILKGIRLFTRAVHKALIKYDPFAQLEVEKQKMLENQRTFRIAKQNIASLKTEMEAESSNAEKEAESGQTRIIALQGKAEKIKLGMDEMVKKLGVAAKAEDEYVNYASELQKVLAEAQRVANKLNQSKDFVQKYGSRAAIMKKMGQKLTMVETVMDIKIQDFDATVDMLKKDYEFGQKSNAATSAAKSAMGFTKGWEFDYALDVVTSTIANDIAITAGNLKDIETLTSNYSLDSDELYANLNQIADKIKVGQDIIPDAKQYSNPEYQLTSSDRTKSGGFGDLF
jgi:predicted DNA-binding ArsR family transcriptional regulator